MSLKITGGQARGRSIASPRGQSVRPTASKIRQALFNILAGRVVGARFLDLFAGTGLMGIEALSRGASDLTAIEIEGKLARNITAALVDLSFQGEVIVGDVRQVLSQLPPRHYDIIFADPPYKSPLARSALHLVDRFDLINRQDGLLIIEHARDTELPVDKVSLKLVNQREYGQTYLSFFQSDSQPQDQKT